MSVSSDARASAPEPSPGSALPNAAFDVCLACLPFPRLPASVRRAVVT